jgi:hypothetical protein
VMRIHADIVIGGPCDLRISNLGPLNRWRTEDFELAGDPGFGVPPILSVYRVVSNRISYQPAHRTKRASGWWWPRPVEARVLSPREGMGYEGSTCPKTPSGRAGPLDRQPPAVGTPQKVPGPRLGNELREARP